MAESIPGDKFAKISKKQRRTPNVAAPYRKSVLLTPFPVTNLRPEVELMHCACAEIIATKAVENGVVRRKSMCVYRTMNSNMTLDFKL